MSEERERAAFNDGVTEGIRQATEAHRMKTDVMVPSRLAAAISRMVPHDGRINAGELMVSPVTPVELAVELARRYNAEKP